MQVMPGDVFDDHRHGMMLHNVNRYFTLTARVAIAASMTVL